MVNLLWSGLQSVHFSGGDDSEKTTLFVGVLSAPPNTAARRAIRETWGQLKNNRSIELKFLIGEELCPYPPEDRIAPYGCNLWLVNNPRGELKYYTHNLKVFCILKWDFIDMG